MINHIYVVIEIINILAGIHIIGNRRFRLDLLGLVIVGVDIAVTELVNRQFIEVYFIIPVYILVFLYAMRIQEYHFKIALVSFGLSMIMVGIFQMLIGLLWMFLFPELPEFLMAFMANLITFCLLMFLRKQLMKLFGRITQHNRVIYGIIICFLGYIIFYAVRSRRDMGIPVDYFLFLLVIGVLIILFAFFWQKEREQLKYKELELKMHELYEEPFQQLISSIREKQHDFHNHIHALRGMHYTFLTYEELVKGQEDYFDQLTEESRYYRLLSSGCKSILVGFLYGKFMEAENKNIHVDYALQLTKTSWEVPDHILIEILGILLDNAMEYVEQKELGQIGVVLRDFTGKLSIEVSNPVVDFTYSAVDQWMQRGVSSKPGHQGVGLAKITSYAEQYGMYFQIRPQKMEDQDWLCMSVKQK